MKFIFKIAIGLLLAGSFACRPAAAPESLPVRDRGDVQRLVGLLDYRAADYGRAVENGQVVNEAEYAEQIQFSHTGKGLLSGLLQGRDDEHAAALRRDMDETAQLVGEKAAADTVAARCR